MDEANDTTMTETSRAGGPMCRSAQEQDLLVARTSALLRAHIPLCLLLDIVDRAEPDSAGCFAREGADLDWLPRPRPS